jgi:hypothetical protein
VEAPNDFGEGRLPLMLYGTCPESAGLRLKVQVGRVVEPTDILNGMRRWMQS